MLHLNTATSTKFNLNLTSPFMMPSPDLEPAEKLRSENTQEVLDFLNLRPVHTVVMTSFIQDNGIESDLNRGKFFGCRNRKGELEGVALIGHSTLVEAHTDAALKALAIAARDAETPLHLIMSSGHAAQRFWDHLTSGLRQPRLTCTEKLFETAFPFMVPRSERQVENATSADLLQVAEAQAEVAFIESGTDPMVRDRDGFLKRVARRIEQDRVFVVRENGKMIFKADIIAETDSVIYLEGIYVAPEWRGRGVGSECLKALVFQLLDRAEHICLLSNNDFTNAHRSFERAGLKSTDACTTLFV